MAYLGDNGDPFGDPATTGESASTVQAGAGGVLPRSAPRGMAPSAIARRAARRAAIEASRRGASRPSASNPAGNGDPLGDPALTGERVRGSVQADRSGNLPSGPGGRTFVATDRPDTGLQPAGETPDARRARVLRKVQAWAYRNARARGLSEGVALKAASSGATSAYAKALVEGDADPGGFARGYETNPAVRRTLDAGGTAKAATQAGARTAGADLVPQLRPSERLRLQGIRQGMTDEAATAASDDPETLARFVVDGRSAAEAAEESGLAGRRRLAGGLRRGAEAFADFAADASAPRGGGILSEGLRAANRLAAGVVASPASILADMTDPGRKLGVYERTAKGTITNLTGGRLLPDADPLTTSDAAETIADLAAPLVPGVVKGMGRLARGAAGRLAARRAGRAVEGILVDDVPEALRRRPELGQGSILGEEAAPPAALPPRRPSGGAAGSSGEGSAGEGWRASLDDPALPQGRRGGGRPALPGRAGRSGAEPRAVPSGAGNKVVGPDGAPTPVFHGTRRVFGAFSDGAQAHESLYGPGHYFTEDPDVASGYAHPPKGTVFLERGESPEVRQTRLDLRRPLDIDAPADPELSRYVEENGGDVAGGTNKSVYRGLERVFGGERGDVNDFLKARGYDGITHVGGGPTGGKAHRVWIAFEEGAVGASPGSAPIRAARELPQGRRAELVSDGPVVSPKRPVAVRATTKELPIARGDRPTFDPANPEIDPRADLHGLPYSHVVAKVPQGRMKSGRENWHNPGVPHDLEAEGFREVGRAPDGSLLVGARSSAASEAAIRRGGYSIDDEASWGEARKAEMEAHPLARWRVEDQAGYDRELDRLKAGGRDTPHALADLAKTYGDDVRDTSLVPEPDRARHRAAVRRRADAATAVTMRRKSFRAPGETASRFSEATAASRPVAFRGRSAEGFPFVEERMAPREIGIRPGMQHKLLEVDDPETATGSALRDVRTYDHATAPPLAVWEEAGTGKRFVIDGHHRRELAIRTGEKDVATRVFKESEGVTEHDARTMGLLMNLRSGKGTGYDAALAMRRLGISPEDLTRLGVPKRSAVVRDAQSLAKLSDHELEHVRSGRLSEGFLAGLADGPLTPEQRGPVIAKVLKGEGEMPETRAQGEAIARQASKYAAVATDDGGGNLFGNVEMDVPFVEAGRIEEGVLAALRRMAHSKRMLTRGKAEGATSVDRAAQHAAADKDELVRQTLASNAEAQRMIEEGAAVLAKDNRPFVLGQEVKRVVDHLTGAKSGQGNLGVSEPRGGYEAEGRPPRPIGPEGNGARAAASRAAMAGFREKLASAMEAPGMRRHLEAAPDGSFRLKDPGTLLEGIFHGSGLARGRDWDYSPKTGYVSIAGREYTPDRIGGLDGLPEDVAGALRAAGPLLPSRTEIDLGSGWRGGADRGGGDWERAGETFGFDGADLARDLEEARAPGAASVGAAESFARFSRQRGALFPGGRKPPKPRVKPAVDHLGSARPERPDVGGLGTKLEEMLVDDRAGAKEAVADLGALLGRDLRGTELDLVERLDAAGRAAAKGEMYARHGIPDANGGIVPGLDALEAEAKRLGIDLEEWKRYRRARRRTNDIDGRPDALKQTPAQLAESLRTIADMRAAHGADLGKLDKAYDDLTRADLEHRERSGLLEPGGAAALAAKNPNYFPGHRMPTPEELEASHFGAGAGGAGSSPGAEIHKSLGHDSAPMDGLDATGLGIEAGVRAAATNDAARPFLEEAARHPEMERWVRKVLYDAEGNRIPAPHGYVAVKTYDAGKEVLYDVSPRVVAAMRGTEPLKGAMRNLSEIAKKPANSVRAMTTAANPFFKVLFNPSIDVLSAVMNHGFNPLRLAQGARAAAKGAKSDLYREWVESLGSQGAGVRDYVERSYRYARTPARFQRLMESKGVRVLSEGWEWLDRVSEGSTRVGYYAQRKKAYLGKGLPVEEARRRAAQDSADLMNFGRAGTIGKSLQRAGGAYANLPAQELAQMAKGYRRNPAAFVARYGAAMWAAKAWYDSHLKDDKDYQELSPYAKDRGIYFRPAGGGPLVCLPLPGMMGTLLVGVPRRLSEMQSGETTAADAAGSLASQTAKNLVSSGKPVWAASLEQGTHFVGNRGEVYDAGLGIVRKPAIPAPKDDPETGAKGRPAPFYDDPFRNYLFLKGQAGTLAGTMGRDGAGILGAALGYEEGYPNPLRRYNGDPTEGKRGKVRGQDPAFFDALKRDPEAVERTLADEKGGVDEAFAGKLEEAGWKEGKGFGEQTPKVQALVMNRLRKRAMKPLGEGGDGYKGYGGLKRRG